MPKISYLYLIFISLFFTYTPVQAKCQTYGYQTICDKASEYRNAPKPSAARQDPYGRDTGSNKEDLSWLGPKVENDEEIKSCLRLSHAESMICLGQLKGERARAREIKVIESGGTVTKCVQTGNNITCYQNR